MSPRRSLAGALVVLGLMLASACGSASATSPPVRAPSTPDVQIADAVESPEPEESAAPESPEPEQTAAPLEESEPEQPSLAEQLASADTDLPRAAVGFEALTESAPRPVPVSMSIDEIDVADADIIAVGVNPQDQSFEVPPADQVGWYEFGPAPGEAGSSVLAAHIAYDGVDGVFRYLADVEVGAVVTIGFDDGTEQRYRIADVAEYVKEALPDSLFARTGEPQLALITCGGEFNTQLDSYESNTVAIAVPIT